MLTVDWYGGRYPAPSVKDLLFWAERGFCKTPDGERVATDDPDGWFQLLGFESHEDFLECMQDTNDQEEMERRLQENFEDFS